MTLLNELRGRSDFWSNGHCWSWRRFGFLHENVQLCAEMSKREQHRIYHEDLPGCWSTCGGEEGLHTRGRLRRRKVGHDGGCSYSLALKKLEVTNWDVGWVGIFSASMSIAEWWRSDCPFWASEQFDIHSAQPFLSCIWEAAVPSHPRDSHLKPLGEMFQTPDCSWWLVCVYGVGGKTTRSCLFHLFH